jgi:hypothetical protein
MRKVHFTICMLLVGLLSGCFDDKEAKIGALRKQISENEDSLTALRSQLEKETEKSKGLEARFIPITDWLPIDIDNNSIAISATSNQLFSNHLSASRIPVEYSNVIANHLALSTYMRIKDPESDIIMKQFIEGYYKNIDNSSYPYILILFSSPISINLITDAGTTPTKLKPLEVLLIMKKEKPYLYFKDESGAYLEYTLQENSAYNYNLLFVTPLDYYKKKQHFFNNN